MIAKPSFARLCLVLLAATNCANQGCCQTNGNDENESESSLIFSRLRGSSPFAAPAPPLPPLPPLPPSPPSLPRASLNEAAFESAGPTAANSSSLVWQPLPLRATFRPLNRQQSGGGRGASEPVALISERSISSSDTGANSDAPFGARAFFPTRESFASTIPPPNTFTVPTTTTGAPPTSSPGTTRAPLSLSFEPEDELPTRQPTNRFRPRTEPSSSSAAGPIADERPQPSLPDDGFPVRPVNGGGGGGGGGGATPTANNLTSAGQLASSECFECICEASTNCNVQSKCQTSDVRHTRCGMFLISYDQWLTTGLSKELVTREALARDPAADERAFYECVTSRDCAQRLLTIFAQRHQKDCDRDGRIDCYDLAAVHHSGVDQCASESLLDSQYWSDFNACFGFGR